MQFIKYVVKMPVMNRTAISLPRTVLQQMREFVTAGVRQQVKSAQLTVEITPLENLPAGEPATRRISLVFGLNHAKAIGNLVLLSLRIKAVIGGLTRAYPA